VINPDDMLREYGADAFRLYEMFMGPLEAVKPWATTGLSGTRRFLGRVWALLDKPIVDTPPDDKTLRALHKCIAKVTDDTTHLRFNTAIAAMMTLLNDLSRLEAVPRQALETLALLLAPYASHLAEELWERLGHPPSIAARPWPEFDPALCIDDAVEVPVQVMGKLRAKLVVPRDTSKEVLEQMARDEPAVRKWTEGRTIQKVIVVPGKMVSIVHD
jgi:leucyl-tRNA synthetase